MRASQVGGQCRHHPPLPRQHQRKCHPLCPCPRTTMTHMHWSGHSGSARLPQYISPRNHTAEPIRPCCYKRQMIRPSESAAMDAAVAPLGAPALAISTAAAASAALPGVGPAVATPVGPRLANGGGDSPIHIFIVRAAFHPANGGDVDRLGRGAPRRGTRGRRPRGHCHSGGGGRDGKEGSEGNQDGGDHAARGAAHLGGTGG